ncbi:hypothetical protein [Galenea microaerophila]
MVKFKVTLEELKNSVFIIRDIEEEDSDYGLDACEHDKFERWVRYRVQFINKKENEQDLIFSFDVVAESKSHSYRESYDFKIDIAHEPYFESNFIVVDEDGDELNFGLVEILEVAKEVEHWEERIKELLPKPEEAEVLEEDEKGTDMDFEEFILERDSAPDLKFVGNKVAEVVTDENSARWLELALYKTKGGQFICQKIEKTRWLGEVDHYYVQICATEDEVKQYFGQGRYSKELYRKAEIENVEFIE